MKHIAQLNRILLRKIFFTTAHEPELPGHSPDHAPAEKISFGKAPALPDGWHRASYAFVCNPDGSIRWLYPVESRKPLFLRLYNSAGWRGRLFSSAFRMAFALGAQRLLQHGVVHIDSPQPNRIAALASNEHAHQHAIFTGTVGENRKAIVLLQHADKKASFVKIPLTPSAADLVLNEFHTLNSLLGLHFDKLLFPHVRRLEAGILLSDIRPPHPIPSSRFTDLHLQALVELTRQTAFTASSTGFLPTLGILRQLQTLQATDSFGELDPGTVLQLRKNLFTLQERLSHIEHWPVSLSHGDFTPWNLYLCRRAIHLYDWELAKTLPWLYDAFHFIFQTGILLRRETLNSIIGELNHLGKQPAIRNLLRHSTASFDELLGFYLLHNTAYYLPRYVVQKPLHRQAHWLLHTWAQAVDWWLAATHRPLASRTRRPAETSNAEV